jgi:hypothetical protein
MPGAHHRRRRRSQRCRASARAPASGVLTPSATRLDGQGHCAGRWRAEEVSASRNALLAVELAARRRRRLCHRLPPHSPAPLTFDRIRSAPPAPNGATALSIVPSAPRAARVWCVLKNPPPPPPPPLTICAVLPAGHALSRTKTQTGRGKRVGGCALEESTWGVRESGMSGRRRPRVVGVAILLVPPRKR